MDQLLLEDILRLSEAMLSAARTENFEQMAQLEQRRGQLLQRIAELKMSPLELTSALQQVRELDQAILTILERERDQAVKALRELRYGRRAARIYAEGE